ncbi:MAG: M13 family metallopeptidase [Deltaproteobacteria bacterium]|nr:M13 family metallopeptidase [Deltaproteobacteria bacterium]
MSSRNALTLLAIAACSAKAPGLGTNASGGSAVAPAGGAGVGSGSSTPVARLPANAVKVTLADVGLEASSLDRTADPCLDFYQYACGGWLATNPIPADRARWARFSEIDEKTKTATKALLEEAAKGIGADTATKKLGDFYAACMDEGAIERAGIASIKPLLDKVTKIRDARTWLTALVELHRHGHWVVWRVHAMADLEESTTNVMYLETSGLGLPDRDYYVKPELKDKVDAYKLHVGKLLALGGMAGPAADTAAGDVLAIEIELANLTKTGVESRDVPASYNPTDAVALGKQVKSIDWKAYWKGLGVVPSKKLVIGTPKFFAALDKVRGKFTFPQWTSYFTYHLLHDAAFALPKAFDDEAFQLERAISGVEKQRERSKRCIEATQGALGELLGAQYIAKYFPPASRQMATGYIDAIIKVMGDEIGRLTWMSEDTRKIATAKLGKVARMIGYPDKFRTYDYEVRRDDFAGNSQRSAVFETKRVLSRAGKPVDRSEWQMDTYTVNAYYDPTANTTALPAGILQPPFFGPERSVAANLGGIGMVIGHELTHGFDDQGAQFDADGNLKNWWKPDDEAAFKTRGTCVADQYSTFEALPKQFVQGRLTLGEDIADLGGVKMAFKAYRSLRKDAPKVFVADGFDEDQQFFLAVGQAWCSKDRPAEVQRRLTTDRHSPPKFRVFGALRNLPEFSQSFRCAAGTAMRPANACSVW